MGATTVRAHEFGHLIGMYDEYPEGAVHPLRKSEDVPDSIMNRGARIYERHVAAFFEWLNQKAKPAIGNLELIRV